MSISYSEFKEKMDDLLQNYQSDVDWVKDNIKKLKDIITHWKTLFETLVMLWGATKTVAEMIGGLPDDLQHTYLGDYIDDLIKFKNPIFEMVDGPVIKMLLQFLDTYIDSVFTEKAYKFKDFAEFKIPGPGKKVKVTI